MTVYQWHQQRSRNVCRHSIRKLLQPTVHSKSSSDLQICNILLTATHHPCAVLLPFPVVWQEEERCHWGRQWQTQLSSTSRFQSVQRTSTTRATPSPHPPPSQDFSSQSPPSAERLVGVGYCAAGAVWSRRTPWPDEFRPRTANSWWLGRPGPYRSIPTASIGYPWWSLKIAASPVCSVPQSHDYHLPLQRRPTTAQRAPRPSIGQVSHAPSTETSPGAQTPQTLAYPQTPPGQPASSQPNHIFRTATTAGVYWSSMYLLPDFFVL